ncbi:hypothetical protein A9Q78_10515 [Methylophaga sp. 41_12_T18]|nr:hypothetical protein A9Q78_10515 [Methylophaga sp. 41_12_T18]
MNSKGNVPFILAGCRRSGTTILSLLLSSHPEVFFAGEMHFVFDYFDAEKEFPNTSEYRKCVYNDRRFLLWNVQLKGIPFPELVNDLIKQKKNNENNDNPLSGICVHENFAGALKLWPETKFIHLVKDPRDVASSYVSAGWAGNVWYGVEPWIETEQQWIEIKKILPENRYIEVQFEQLIGEPKKELIKICNFLEIAYEEEMFSLLSK